MSSDRLYTMREVGSLLGVDPRTVRSWIDTGDIPGVTLGCRCYVHGDVLASLLRRAGKGHETANGTGQ